MPELLHGRSLKFIRPETFAAREPRAEYRRVMGLDLGTLMGIAYLDMPVAAASADGCDFFAAMWNLAPGDGESSAVRPFRFNQFMDLADPDIVFYENPRYQPPKDMFAGKMESRAVVERVAQPLMILGGLKMVLQAWCERYGVPAIPLTIQDLKQTATGGRRADKEAMICEARDRLGLQLDPAAPGHDNVADAAWALQTGLLHFNLQGQEIYPLDTGKTRKRTRARRLPGEAPADFGGNG